MASSFGEVSIVTPGLSRPVHCSHEEFHAWKIYGQVEGTADVSWPMFSIFIQNRPTARYTKRNVASFLYQCLTVQRATSLAHLRTQRKLHRQLTELIKIVNDIFLPGPSLLSCNSIARFRLICICTSEFTCLFYQHESKARAGKSDQFIYFLSFFFFFFSRYEFFRKFVNVTNETNFEYFTRLWKLYASFNFT